MSEFYLISGVALLIDGVGAVITYAVYFHTKKLFNALSNSMNNEIDIKTIGTTKNFKEPLLGLVRGTVKSLGPPIKSLNKPSVSGVIQKLTIREHCSEKRAPGYWSDSKKILDEKWNVVPFEIRSKNKSIVFTSPMIATSTYLNLEVIDDRFEPTISSLLNLVFGIHQKGFQYTEFLLKENTMVTAFGEFSFGEKGELQLVPPKNGVCYVLSTMDPETLLREVRAKKVTSGMACIFFVSVGIAILGFITFKLWIERRARLEQERKKRELLQRRALRTANLVSDNEELICIVCLSKRREVVLLPCGHICLCYDCSVQLCQRPCPVCQQHVTDVHLIFIP